MIMMMKKKVENDEEESDENVENYEEEQTLAKLREECRLMLSPWPDAQLMACKVKDDPETFTITMMMKMK